MAERHATTPFGDEPDEKFTFSDVTLLAFLGVLAVVLTAVFLLGAVCAEHRIAASLILL